MEFADRLNMFGKTIKISPIFQKRLIIMFIDWKRLVQR